MIRISSNITLFLKIFIPTFWIVFFSLFCIAILLDDDMMFFPSNPLIFKGIVLGFFLFFLFLLKFTLMKLKRVEIDNTYLYVSNYFKTYRFLLKDVSKVKTRDWLIFKTMHFHFQEKTSFGKKIHFILKESHLKTFLDNNENSIQLPTG
jgi:hypothetical protein